MASRSEEIELGLEAGGGEQRERDRTSFRPRLKGLGNHANEFGLSNHSGISIGKHASLAKRLNHDRGHYFITLS